MGHGIFGNLMVPLSNQPRGFIQKTSLKGALTYLYKKKTHIFSVTNHCLSCPSNSQFFSFSFFFNKVNNYSCYFYFFFLQYFTFYLCSQNRYKKTLLNTKKKTTKEKNKCQEREKKVPNACLI